jgi:hypothetical protein
MDVIVGAGLAGLIAAHAWPNARIIEASDKPRDAHKALLRFRSEAVSQLTGIEFRKVCVRKGVWSGERNGFVEPSIRMSNLYSSKVLGGRLVGDRSIWSVEAVERFVAPENIYSQLLAAVGSRISWGEKFDFKACSSANVVSTAPLHTTARSFGLSFQSRFERQAISVRRWRISGADLFQTIYFPEPSTPIYRASITGDILIAELQGPAGEDVLHTLSRAFGIDLRRAESLGEAEQAYGKIAPIDDDERKRLLFELTTQFGVFSLGRFACWRNILLDDVVRDIGVIKRLVKSTSQAYDVRRAIN